MIYKFFALLLILGVLMSASLLPQYEERILDNGLKVVVIPLKGNSGVISTQIVYKVGSKDEVMGKSGIAHMLEHLNFKSTKNLKAGEFDEIIKSFGGINNASTSFDWTKYYINASSENLEKTLELFSELMSNQLLLDKEFQTEREVVYEERRWRTDNSPTGYLYFKLFNALFTYSSYHWTPIGFREDIENWDISDIKEFYNRFYQPSNAILIVSGDVDSKMVFTLADKYFKKIKNRDKIKRNHMIEPKQNGQKEVIINKSSKVEYIALAYHTPKSSDKSSLALSVLSNILSDGKTSKLYKTLVNEKNLFTNIYASNYALSQSGVFLFFGSCAKGVSVQKAKKHLLEEIEKIKNGEITEKEFNKVKINTKFDFLSIIESSSRVASLFASYLADDNLESLINYEEELEKLKIKDIKDVANRFLKINNSTTVILVDDKQ